MSMSSCCVSDSCWFESVCDAVGESFTLLNELCVPSHCAWSSGTLSPSAYWNAAARCAHELGYALTLSFRTSWPSGSTHSESGTPARRHSAAAASASLSAPMQAAADGLACEQVP